MNTRHVGVKARMLQVIKTTTMQGAGTPESPIREVVHYWSFQGELLAERDPFLCDVPSDLTPPLPAG